MWRRNSRSTSRRWSEMSRIRFINTIWTEDTIILRPKSSSEKLRRSPSSRSQPLEGQRVTSISPPLPATRKERWGSGQRRQSHHRTRLTTALLVMTKPPGEMLQPGDPLLNSISGSESLGARLALEHGEWLVAIEFIQAQSMSIPSH